MKRIIVSVIILSLFSVNCHAFFEVTEKTRQNFGMSRVSYATMQGGNITYASDDYTYLSGSVAKGFAAELVQRLISLGILSGNEEKYGYSIKEILTHQNSLSPYLGSLAGFALQSRTEILDILKNQPTGDKSFSYQNITFLILEEIIEDATGKPYSQALKYYLLDPLKLYSSGSGYDDFVTRWNMYPPTFGTTIAPESFSRAVCAYEAAAGIFCSAGDLMRWGGYVFSSHRLDDYKNIGVKLENGTTYYGGWYIDDNIAYSCGTILGGGAVCAVDIKSGNGIAILASGDSSPLVSLALEYFKDDKKPIEKLPSETHSLPHTETSTDISGEYINPLYGTLSVTKDSNEYHVNLANLSSRLSHVCYNIFELSDIPPEAFQVIPGMKYIHFATDDRGNAVSASIEAIYTEGSGIFIKK